jgi:putative tryptophan/tyrosine transport system substrate-binding protein
MRRREFIGLLGTAALSFPRPGHAQTKTDLPVVGLVLPLKSDTTNARNRVAAIRKGLQEAGFIEGTNYSLAVRFAEGDVERLPQLVMELGALKPRVIVTTGYVSRSFSQFVPDVPMVFTGIAVDPVEIGLAQSYTHPGGMITGNVMNAAGGELTIAQKRIGLFKQLVPDLTRLGVIAPAPTFLELSEKERLQKRRVAQGYLAMKEKEALQQVGAQLGFEVIPYDLKTIDDLESAFAAGVRDDVSAFYISTEPMLYANLSRVVSFATASRKPSVSTVPDWARGGLLMAYATDLLDGALRAGIYAAKILNGAKPGDLPIEQASKFTLVINQKTAMALGIVVPPTLLALADEVIE